MPLHFPHSQVLPLHHSPLSSNSVTQRGHITGGMVHDRGSRVYFLWRHIATQHWIPYPVLRIRHRGTPILTGMGDRKCEFDGCNALEFRTSGYCLRHKDGRAEIEPDLRKPDLRKPDIRELSVKGFFDFMSKLLGITIVALIFASIFFPIHAFVFATNLANLFAGTSNGDEPLMLSPIFCIIPVLLANLVALVIGKFLKK